jgi:CelD/BcsL family acetyltransferase involved in cellulose biosynthesis
MTEVCRVLGAVDPPADLIILDGVSVGERWPDELRVRWPGGRRPELLRDIARPAPAVDLGARTYEDWLAAKSKNFREQMRRRRRKLDKMGASFRLTEDARGSERDIESFIRLHHSRWQGRGGSGVLTNAVERMLPAVASGLLSKSRFRLWTLEIEQRAISSHLFIAAGGEVSYWLGGFDEAWSAQQPSLQVLIAAIEDAWARGDRRVDLGGGGQAYKYRLADSVENLHWSYLVPHGSGYGRTRVELFPRLAKRALLARIPNDAKDRVKRVLGRPTSGAS